MPTIDVKTVKSSGGDYSSLAAWEAGEQQNQVTADTINVAECYNFEDTTPVTIGGWTTNTTHPIRIMAAESEMTEQNRGIWSTERYRLVCTNSDCISDAIQSLIHEEFYNIQTKIINNIDNTTADCYYLGANVSSFSVPYSLIVNPICVGQNDGNLTNTIVRGIETSANQAIAEDSTYRIYNGIFYNFVGERAGEPAGCIVTAKDHGGRIYNCTFKDSNRGILSWNAASTDNWILKNNVANDCTDGFDDTTGPGWGTGTDYNASDIASDAPGANSKNGTSGIGVFLDPDNDDFRLSPDDVNLKDAGTDLSADPLIPFNEDISGNIRDTGAWDIGASEAQVTVNEASALFLLS